MRYYSEDTVKRILYDIDYNWESLPAPLEDYKSLELDNDFGAEKGPWLEPETWEKLS